MSPEQAARVLARGLKDGHDRDAVVAVIPTANLKVVISDLGRCADKIDRLNEDLEAAVDMLYQWQPDNYSLNREGIKAMIRVKADSR